MILPAPIHFQIMAREAFTHKTATSRQPDGGMVTRLDVGFHTMESEFSKGVFQNKLNSFAHQSFPRVGRKGVVANIRPLEQSANDIAQVDDPDNLVRLTMHNQKSSVRIRSRAPHICFEFIPRVRRRDPWMMKGAASSHRRLKSRPIAKNRRPYGHSHKLNPTLATGETSGDKDSFSDCRNYLAEGVANQ